MMALIDGIVHDDRSTCALCFFNNANFTTHHHPKSDIQCSLAFSSSGPVDPKELHAGFDEHTTNETALFSSK